MSAKWLHNRQLDPKLAQHGADLVASWAQVAPTWSQVGPKLGQLGPTWAKLAPSWGQVGSKLANLEAKLAPKSKKRGSQDDVKKSSKIRSREGQQVADLLAP